MKGVVLILLLTIAMLPGISRSQSRILVTDTTGVIIHADPRLDIVTAALRPKTERRNTGNASSGRSGVIRSGRGYRVQIYNGNDRTRATNLKVDFMRRFPNVRTYMTYIQPQFRVKVGDFTTRQEAQRFAGQINTIYSPVMIVPDIIVINTFRND